MFTLSLLRLSPCSVRTNFIEGVILVALHHIATEPLLLLNRSMKQTSPEFLLLTVNAC